MEEFKCAICSTSKDERIILFNIDTFNKCVKILEIRKKFSLKFKDIMLPATVNETIGYHSTCYKNFSALKKKYKEEERAYDYSEYSLQGSTSQLGQSRHCIKTELILDCIKEEENDQSLDKRIFLDAENDVCFFCNKTRKTVKGSVQKLSSSDTGNWLEGIKDKAAEIDDMEMLWKITSASKDTKYHHQCKVSYYNKCVKICTQFKEPTIWHEKRDHHNTAFQNLCEYVLINIIKKRECAFYNFVRSKYIEYLNEKYSDIDDDDRPNFFSTQDLQAKLLNAFPNQIKFATIKNKKIIAPYEYTVIDNIEIIKKMEENQLIVTAATKVRSDILTINKKEVPEEESSKNFIDGESQALPDSLILLLKTIICGDSVRNTNMKEVVISSIAQDIMYSARGGTLKPSKHIRLGMALKRMTNSKKVINILNKLGHCLNYSQLSELETEATIYSSENEEICADKIVKLPDMRTAVAFGNFDRFVDTGNDTVHDTVGIIYQNIREDEEQISNMIDVSHIDDSERMELSEISSTSTNNEVNASNTSFTTTTKKRRRTFDAILPKNTHYHKKPKIFEVFKSLSAEIRSKISHDQKNYNYLNLAWMLTHALGTGLKPILDESDEESND